MSGADSDMLLQVLRDPFGPSLHEVVQKQTSIKTAKLLMSVC